MVHVATKASFILFFLLIPNFVTFRQPMQHPLYQPIYVDDDEFLCTQYFRTTHCFVVFYISESVLLGATRSTLEYMYAVETVG